MRGLLAVLLAGLLAGCGRPSPLTAMDAPKLDNPPGVAVAQAWSRDVGGADALYLGLTPAVAKGRVYTAASSGTVTAVDASSGDIAWTRSLQAGLAGGPTVSDGLLVIGSESGRIRALAAADGADRWQTRLSSEVLAPAAIGQDIVLLRSNDGRVFALEEASGEQRWLYDRSVPPLTLRGTASPVLVRGGAIVGFDNGRLVALKLADGTPAWETTIGLPRGDTDLARMVDVDGEPAVIDDVVYAVGYQSRIVSLRLRDGEINWARDISGFAGLVADTQRVYVPSAEGELITLARDGGTTVWQQSALSGLILTAPVRFGEYLVVGASDGYLYWLDPERGIVLGRRYAGGGRIVAPPVVDGDILFALTVSGELSAWRLASVTGG